MLVQKFTILQFFFYKSILNLLKPLGVNTAKADRTMTAQSEKSIICKKPRLTALHAGIVLTPLNADNIALRNLQFSVILYYKREIDAPTPDWAVNFPCVIQND